MQRKTIAMLSFAALASAIPDRAAGSAPRRTWSGSLP
jgi:hypothetical protein